MVDPKLVKRFSEKWKLNSDSGCWEWTASLAGKGYGQIKIPGERKQMYAHRLSWMIHKGEVPQGKSVLHRCDNPKCVNPNHLFVGTHQDNSTDMKGKGRHLYGERNDRSILTESDVRAIKTLLEEGSLPQWRIAEMFGIQQMQVSRIKRGLRWSHVK